MRELHKIESDVYIVGGTPFLYIESQYALILGDMHIGQEQAILPQFYSKISTPTRIIIDLILDIVSRYTVKKIIFNGDTKHEIMGILSQEITEIQYIIDKLGNNIDIIFVKGNHDALLNILLGKIGSTIRTVDSFQWSYMDRKLIVCHGHQSLNGKYDIIIINHEHPAYSIKKDLKSYKLPAFVLMYTDCSIIIALPHANDISGGVLFPPTQYLSPILNNCNIKKMYIYPFDREIGLFPPIHIQKL